jgi:hypothetical protein
MLPCLKELIKYPNVKTRPAGIRTMAICSKKLEVAVGFSNG